MSHDVVVNVLLLHTNNSCAGGAQAGCGGLLGSLLACLGGGAQPQGEGQQQPGEGGQGSG
jgi:hypothetical protein